MNYKRCLGLVKSFVVVGLLSGCAGQYASKLPQEPVVEYFKLDGGKLKPGAVKVSAYYEIEKDGLTYVFISPKAKAKFEESKNPDGSSVGCFGFIKDCENVILDSELAIPEYKKRHDIK